MNACRSGRGHSLRAADPIREICCIIQSGVRGVVLCSRAGRAGEWVVVEGGLQPGGGEFGWKEG